MTTRTTESPTSKKVESSMEGSPINVPANPGKAEVGSDNKNPSFKVKDLGKLDLKKVESFLQRKEDYALKIKSQFAENFFRMGIYEEDSKTYFVCPRGLFDKYEDKPLGGVILDLAKLLSIEVRLVDKDVELTTAYNEKFILGCWFGFFAKEGLRRNRTKSGYELGRTCVQSLIVKNMYAEDPNLGEAALIKDNYFFGNNPGEVNNRNETVPYLLKTRLLSYFTDFEVGNLFFGILNHCASRIGFRFLDTGEQDKLMDQSLTPIESIITSCYSTVTVKQGRKEVEKTRKPNPLKVSPLFLSEEMSLITDICSLIFADLGILTENYQSLVYRRGFSAIVAEIKTSIKTRWETLQRFAKITKLRLQEIRKISGDTKIRKAGVKPIHVAQLLSNRIDQVRSLTDEIMHIVGARSLKELCVYKFNVNFDKVELYEKFIMYKCFDLYSKLKVEGFKSSLGKIELVNPESNLIDFNESLKGITKIDTIIGELIKQTKNLPTLPAFKVIGRADNIEGLIGNFDTTVKEVTKLPLVSLDIAVKLLSKEKFKSFNEYMKHSTEKFYNLLTVAQKAAAGWIFSKAEDVFEKRASALIKVIRSVLKTE